MPGAPAPYTARESTTGEGKIMATDAEVEALQRELAAERQRRETAERERDAERDSRLRAEGERAETLAQQQATSEVLKLLGRSAFDLQGVLDTINQHAVRLCDADSGLLWRHDGRVFRLDAVIEPVWRELPTFYRDVYVSTGSGSIIQRVAVTGRTCHLVDAREDPEISLLPSVTRFGVRSFLGVPVLSDGAVIGVLSLTRQEVRPFTDRQIALVESFADQAAIAMESVRLFNEIQSKSRELDSANQAKSDFLSRMSHELRTPMNAIIGFAEIMELDPATPPTQQPWIQHMLRAGRHLLGLINEVLDIARIEAGRLSLSLEPVDVAGVVEEVHALVRSLADKNEIALDMDGAVIADAWVQADRQRLQQVLLNFVTNAIKYNRREGRVTVTAANGAAGRLRLTVCDTGAGIPPEKLGRLFTPFDRLGAEETGIEGNGLGLAITRRLVEAMDGAVGVDSVLGEGCTFWLELPREAAPARALPAAVETLMPAEHAANQSATVLYIEDNRPNLELMEAIVARSPGITLLSAMQGTQGLALAREHRPDLILLDLNLPDMHGDEVLARLRRHPATRAIPVAVISADATLAQRQRSLAGGASAYLTKPLQVRDVRALLDHTLGAGDPARGEPAAGPPSGTPAR
jgi:signal transduction histidine kinase/ActR/RegA family two-component response regulator